MNEGDGLDVRQVLNLQRHGEQLGQEMSLLQVTVAQAAEHVETCFAELVKASQTVRAIEILVERQVADDEAVLERTAARDFDDVVTSRCWKTR